MLPAIAEVVSVIDDGLSRLEHVAHAHLGRRDARLASPVVIYRQTVSLLADRELPEVAIEPSDDDLDDVVQDLAALRLFHPNDLLRTVDMLDLQPDHFASTQAAAITETEQHADLEVRSDGQQALIVGLLGLNMFDGPPPALVSRERHR